MKNMTILSVFLLVIAVVVVVTGIFYVISDFSDSDLEPPKCLTEYDRNTSKADSITIQINPNRFVDLAISTEGLGVSDFETIYLYENGLVLQRTVLSTSKPCVSMGYKEKSLLAASKEKSLAVPIEDSYTFYTNWDNKRYIENEPTLIEVEADVPTEIGVNISKDFEIQGSNANYLFATVDGGFIKVNKIIAPYEDVVNEYAAKMETCYRRNFSEYYNSNGKFYTRCREFSVAVDYINANTCICYSAKGDAAQFILLNEMYNR